MFDCYKILGIPQHSTLAEIKRAYRKKAKELHPDLLHDLSSEQQEVLARKFQDVVKAYEILSDVRERSLFDVSYQAYKSYTQTRTCGFDYRTWLLERADEESLSKLIFFDLIHHREDEACSRFKQMNSSKMDYRLSRYFSREDFMDYGFILAEELVIRHEYYDAILLLEQIIRMEYSYSYFKLFFPEVMKLAMGIYRNHITGVLSDELAIDVFERALELGFGVKNDAFFLYQISICYKNLGDEETAKFCALKANELEIQR